MTTTIANSVVEATCPACGYHVAVTFYQGGHQPLATLGWPRSPEAAQAMPALPLDFVRCVDCGHVFNAAFDYANVPYTDQPNLMFNAGKVWSGFIRDMQTHMLSRLPDSPVVVEIGHGDGSFLAALADTRPAGRYFGFDPHGVAATATNSLEFRAELFDPARHFEELRPDLVVSRHVLEHLMNPVGFLQRMSFKAASLGLNPLAYFEVPCIDAAIAAERTHDFYYEHSSQFTTNSFLRMLSRCAAQIDVMGHGYDGEVIYGFVRLGGDSAQLRHAVEAERFRQAAESSWSVIRAELEELHRSGRRVAIWGGTGKSAAFMQRHGVDAERFPVVVDSDAAKVGTYVPGTGQEIRPAEWLADNPADVVIIPPQWRAKDILIEMRELGVRPPEVLTDGGGSLARVEDQAA